MLTLIYLYLACLIHYHNCLNKVYTLILLFSTGGGGPGYFSVLNGSGFLSVEAEGNCVDLPHGYLSKHSTRCLLIFFFDVVKDTHSGRLSWQSLAANAMAKRPESEGFSCTYYAITPLCSCNSLHLALAYLNLQYFGYV